MESSTLGAWLAKIGFWVTLALLSTGIFMTRSPWWLVGFGLFWLASLSLLAKCRMSSSAVFSLILCDIYFIVVSGVIVSNKDASAWWLTIALLLEIMFVGYAQNQIDEEEKKQEQEAPPEKSEEEDEEDEESAEGDNEGDDVDGTNNIKSLQMLCVTKLIEKMKGGDVVDQAIGEWFESINQGVIPGGMKDFNKLDKTAKNIFVSKLTTTWRNAEKQLRSQGISLGDNAIVGLVAGTLFAIRFSTGAMCDPLTEKLFAVTSYIGTPLSKAFIKVLPDLKKGMPEIFASFEEHALYNYLDHLIADKEYSVEDWSDLVLLWAADNTEESFSRFAEKKARRGSSILEEIINKK